MSLVDLNCVCYQVYIISQPHRVHQKWNLVLKSIIRFNGYRVSKKLFKEFISMIVIKRLQ